MHADGNLCVTMIRVAWGRRRIRFLPDLRILLSRGNRSKVAEMAPNVSISLLDM